MTYTHNSNGVCSDCDHNPRGSAPNLLKGNVNKTTFPKRTQQRRYKNMSTYAQKLQTVRAQTEKKIATINTATDAKVAAVNLAADAKIARLTGILNIEIERVKAIERLDTQVKEFMEDETAVYMNTEAEPDMNTQTEMEA